MLGRDFIWQNNGVIDLGGHTLRLQKNDLAPIPATPTVCLVRAQCTCVIPPHCEMSMSAKLNNDCPPKLSLIEANGRLVQHYQIQGATVLATVSDSNTAPLRILNLTSHLGPFLKLNKIL